MQLRNFMRPSGPARGTAGPMLAVVALAAAAVLFAGTMAPAAALDVTLTVRERVGVPRTGEVVTTGVPIPRGALASDQAAAISGVDAQFQTLATWADGSVKWLLVSFPVTLSPWQTGLYHLVDGSGDAASGDLVVDQSGGTVTVTTGPLRFTLKDAGFDLFDEVWLDGNGDGTFAPAERMVSPDPANGSIVEDVSGNVFTSAQGPAVNLTVEEAGPVRAVVYFEGKHVGPAGDHLEFSGRVYAYRGRSDVKVQYSQVNMTPTGTYSGGNQPLSRWLTGQGPVGGAVNSRHFEDLSLVTRVDLAGAPRFALEGDPARGLVTGTLTDDAWLYQDSSGGPYWYVTGGTTMGGYQLRLGDEVLDSAARAEGFVDVNDGTRGLAVGIRHFWENFPNKVMVSPDGTITVGVMPRDFSEPYEHRSGERKTHWTLFYFHAGDAAAAGVSDVNAAFQSPLWAIAPAQYYADTDAFDDLVPYDPVDFPDYEAHNAVGADGFFSIREESDWYGWQDFGDAWSDFEGGGAPPNTNNAANNLEYDIGYSFIEQAVRTAGIDDSLFDKWWKLAEEGNVHTADIDLYHVEEGPLHWMWGGMWTHCAHGASGYVDPHRGDVSNGAHSWNRGMIYWYYVSGDRAVLDGALKVGENMTWRVENGPGMPGISGTDGEERGPGHTLQIMTDMYLLTWDQRYLDAARKVVMDSHASTKGYIVDPDGTSWHPKPWMVGILMKYLGRYIQVMEEEAGLVETSAIQSLLMYADWMEREAWVDRSGDLPGYIHYQVFDDGTIIPGGMNVDMWTLLASDAFTFASRYETDPVRAARYRQIAQHAFEDGSAHPWCYTCPDHEWMKVKVHSVVAKAGQEWMTEAAAGGGTSDDIPPAAIGDLAAATGSAAGEIDLTWTASGDDGTSGRATSYRVRRATSPIRDSGDWAAAIPTSGAPIPAMPGTSESMTVSGLGDGETWFFCVRAVDDALNYGDLSNSPSAMTAGDEIPPVLSGVTASETAPGVLEFTWTTDEPATSEIRWDTSWSGSGSLANLIQDGLLKTSHRLELSGLAGGTTIYYRARSVDGAGNLGYDAVRQITVSGSDVTPPVLLLGPVATVDSTGAAVLVSWITDEPATGWVEWGSTTAYGESTTPSTEPATVHQHRIDGLTPGETIHFRVHAVDGASNELVGSDVVFTLDIDVTAPNVSMPTIASSSSQALLTFLADEPCFGSLVWGEDPGTLDRLVVLASASTASVRHEALLEELEVGLTYWWRISLADPSGNVAVESGQFIFTGEGPIDTTPPVPPAGLAVVDYDRLGVALSWAPNGEPDLAGYAVHRRLLDAAGEPSGAWATVSSTVLPEPEFIDSDVVPGIVYEYAITAMDVSSNESGLSESIAFDPAYWEVLRDYLGRAYPNPFRAGSRTSIDFRAPPARGVTSVPAEVMVYDITGRRVAILWRGSVAPGEIKTVTWNGRDTGGQEVASGIFFVQLRVAGENVTRKVTLLH